MIKRGLDEAAVERNGYASYGLDKVDRWKLASVLADEFGRDTLLQVPGFVLSNDNELAIRGTSGILVPARSNGLIVAIKIRAYQGTPKYSTLSSTAEKPRESTGPGPGSRAHIPLAIEGDHPSWVLTEGELKADVYHHLTGEPVVSAPGHGGWLKAVEAVILRGAKTIRLALDADALTNDKVAKSLLDCATYLEAINISFAYLTWDVKDGKGIDDLIFAGHKPHEIEGKEAMAAIREVAEKAGLKLDAPPLKVVGADGTVTPQKKKYKNVLTIDYAEEDGRLCVVKEGKTDANGEQSPDIYIGLCNFVARIDTEECRDNGTQQHIFYRIIAIHQHGGVKTVSVSADEFPSMKWIAQLGAGFVVEAGRGILDHLRSAIMQQDVMNRKYITTYTRTGWERINGEMMYLHGGGAIGADGNDSTIHVDISDYGLIGYELPDPPEGDILKTAVRASLNILKLAQADRPGSRPVAALILCLVYRAIFGKTRFTIQFNGLTGSFKSSAIALAQQHFCRAMNYANLPVGFNSTTNAIQAIRHALADSLVVVDDFVPGGSRQSREKVDGEANDLYRTQGNGTGRRRMNTDGSLRPPMDPKSALATTGEERSSSASANLRTLGGWFNKDDVKNGTKGTIDTAILSQCQADADAGLYVSSMSAFIRWAAPRIEELAESIERSAKEYRALATQPGDHGRTPDIVGELAAGFDMFLDFATQAQAITENEATDYRTKVWDGLIEASDAIRDEMKETKGPADAFLDAIRGAFLQAVAYVGKAHDGDVPDDRDIATACGWFEEFKWQGNDVGQTLVWVHGPNSKRIGWIDEDNLYLEPVASRDVAQKMLREQGATLPATNSLSHLLDSAHKLEVSTGDRKRSRLTTRKSFGKVQHPVWVIKRSVFWDQEPGDIDE